MTAGREGGDWKTSASSRGLRTCYPSCTSSRNCALLSKGRGNITRLETRTKESSECASVWGSKTQARIERELEVPRILFPQHRPTLRFFKRFEYKHIRRDPKDGDLYLCRTNPQETAVEARSRSDVQIDGQK